MSCATRSRFDENALNDSSEKIAPPSEGLLLPSLLEGLACGDDDACWFLHLSKL